MVAKNMALVLVHVWLLGLLVLDQVFWLSSCSRIEWKGEIEWLVGMERLSMILKVDGIVNGFT